MDFEPMYMEKDMLLMWCECVASKWFRRILQGRHRKLKIWWREISSHVNIWILYYFCAACWLVITCQDICWCSCWMGDIGSSGEGLGDHRFGHLQPQKTQSRPNYIYIKNNRRPSPGKHQTPGQRRSSHHHHWNFDLDLLHHNPPSFSFFLFSTFPTSFFLTILT